MKKLIVCVLALALLSSLCAAAWAAESGEADAPADRSMAVSALWLMAGKPVVDYALQYEDVPRGAASADALRWAAENFPGRVWRIKPTPALPKGKELNQANILVRNYPLTPEQLKKKLRLRDGGTDFVIGCRVNGKPTLFLAERV